VTFTIRTMPEPAASRESISPVWGEITLGEYIESFPLMTSLLSASEYEDQWAAAVRAIAQQRVNRAMLVTDIQPPSESSGISYFALFRDGARVFVQQRFMRPSPSVDVRLPEAVEATIPPRFQERDGEQMEVSEWCVPIDDLREFRGG
jgi:hypothetical protein